MDCGLGGYISRQHAKAGPAFNGCLIEKRLCRRHGVKAGRFGAATAFAEDHHVVWVPTKRVDVLVHPLQPVANIQKALVARGGIFITAQFAQVEKAHQAKTMIGGHNHNHPRCAPSQSHPDRPHLA